MLTRPSISKYMSVMGTLLLELLSCLMMQTIVKTMASKLIMACDEFILDTVLIHQSFHYSNEYYYI